MQMGSSGVSALHSTPLRVRAGQQQSYKVGYCFTVQRDKDSRPQSVLASLPSFLRPFETKIALVAGEAKEGRQGGISAAAIF